METQNLKLTQRSFTYKMTIPAVVESKIRYLCSKISTIEWSGVLFFTYEGSFETKDLNIICKDILVMDIGSQAYTEFNTSPDIVAYMTENPELLDCQMGLIHSHNTMATFFSGTDIETLRAEGSERNNFVSLIVNNAGSYTAAITRKVHSRKNITNDVYYEFFGEGTKNDKLSTELEVDEIEYYNLKITKESEAFLDIEERLKEIQKSKVSRPNIPNNYMCRVQQLPFNDPIMDNKEENISKTPTVVKKEENMENSSDSKVDSRMVRSLVIQLLTGSVLMNTETFNMDNWLKNMKLSYDKRFGSPQSLEFVGWSQTISEFITYYIDPENNEIKQSEYAKAILDELLKYPSNPYLDALKDEVSYFVEV